MTKVNVHAEDPRIKLVVESNEESAEVKKESPNSWPQNVINQSDNMSRTKEARCNTVRTKMATAEKGVQITEERNSRKICAGKATSNKTDKIAAAVAENCAKYLSHKKTTKWIHKPKVQDDNNERSAGDRARATEIRLSLKDKRRWAADTAEKAKQQGGNWYDIVRKQIESGR